MSESVPQRCPQLWKCSPPCLLLFPTFQMAFTVDLLYICPLSIQDLFTVHILYSYCMRRCYTANIFIEHFNWFLNTFIFIYFFRQKILTLKGHTHSRIFYFTREGWHYFMIIQAAYPSWFNMDLLCDILITFSLLALHKLI